MSIQIRARRPTTRHGRFGAPSRSARAFQGWGQSRGCWHTFKILTCRVPIFHERSGYGIWASPSVAGAKTWERGGEACSGPGCWLAREDVLGT